MTPPPIGTRVAIPGQLVGITRRPDRFGTVTEHRPSGMVAVRLDTGYPAVVHPEDCRPVLGKGIVLDPTDDRRPIGQRAR